MKNEYFSCKLTNDIVVFEDTIAKDKPCVFDTPRNHESIFFVTKGASLYERDGIRQIIGKGDVGYIARGSVDICSAFECDEVSYIATNFNFDKSNLSPTQTLPFKNICFEDNSLKYEKLFRKLLNISLDKSPAYEILCHGLLLQIIGLLYNDYVSDTESALLRQRLLPSMEYLKENYADTSLKIGYLAKICNMSEKNFRRVFLRAYKTTPYEYLQNFRINKAENLLSFTSKNISDIALQCGFSDVYSFSHCFRNHNQISPTQYRKQQRTYK